MNITAHDKAKHDALVAATDREVREERGPMRILRCYNMIPAHYKWYVSQWKGATETSLFFGTRKQCEAFIKKATTP